MTDAKDGFIGNRRWYLIDGDAYTVGDDEGDTLIFDSYESAQEAAIEMAQTIPDTPFEVVQTVAVAHAGVRPAQVTRVA